ncbi:MAG: hypothetical protein LBI69_01555 [Puniceicoccales bacterium]|nr:hypothetical protein [Puniceicoccales bacterium]
MIKCLKILDSSTLQKNKQRQEESNGLQIGMPFFDLDFYKFLSQNTQTTLSLSTGIGYGVI